MVKTVTIKTNIRGASVTMGTMSSIASIAVRMDGTTGLCMDGTYHGLGFDLESHNAEVETAIMATLSDGQTRTLTFGENEDNTAELDKYDRDHAAVKNAMMLGGHTY